jgi:L-threonylcarbamoyladenylate synthase
LVLLYTNSTILSMSIKNINIWNNTNLVNTIKNGGVVVMPTDTIYGIVGSALNTETVERIYDTRQRTPSKPCIVLIGNMDELNKFDIEITKEQKETLEKYWENMDSGATSIILDCRENQNEKFMYLHRGTKTLAFRLPRIKELRDLLLETGPLIAPSANTEGNNPSKNIQDAKNYFGDKVDLYIDGGEITSKASTIIRLQKDGNVEVLRG